MSYLNFPRLAFSGQFQADVSTVNNDTRHFDNDTFQENFQDFQTQHSYGTQYNGWWNPVGTGIFRLNDCKITALLGPDGLATSDLALGCVLGNSSDQPSGKLVDLDPDWQLASSIYGLSVTLTDANGVIVMQGDYQPNPFRDLWFTRAEGLRGDSAASAMFQSVLTNVQWNLDAIHSPFLQELKATSQEGLLSIRLTTYGYQDAKDGSGFTYGKLVGAIGPVYAHEPRSFVLGRRFMPYVMSDGVASFDSRSTRKITCFSAVVDQATHTVQLDLSNALSTDAHFAIQDLGSRQLVVLKNPDTAQDAVVGPQDYVLLGALNYRQETQEVLSGIQAFKISAEAAGLMANHPLALIAPTPSGEQSCVVIREGMGGLEVRAEDFAFRLDPNHPDGNDFESTVYAAQYGTPLANPQLQVVMNAPAPSEMPASAPAEATPQAAMSTNNIPSLAITATVKEHPVLNQQGVVQIGFQGPKIMNTPRYYVDGQLYTLNYNFSGNQTTVQQQFDNYAVLLFSTFAAPETPSWEDVEPILTQYANLYPVMSKGLFDFSKQAVADANAHIMYFVFSNMDVNDPDYMPVTRDMSYSKRQMLIQYFANVMASAPAPKDTQQRFAARCPMGFDRQPTASR